MQTPPPVLVVHLFPELLAALLELLRGLAPDDWSRPTVAEGWTVHDIALHLLGDEIGMLSRRRDDFREASGALASRDELVRWLNARNADWVKTTRRISPPLVCDLLEFTGKQVNEYFGSLDPFAMGGPVSWVGPDPAQVWLDLAREFTERWHHQQHIRDACGKPGMTEPRYLNPVLATFVRALPGTYRQVDAVEGTAVTLTIVGDAGGTWTIVRHAGDWQLFVGQPEQPDVQVSLPQDIAWRLFTKGVTKEFARRQAVINGNERLGLQMFEVVSIIA